MKFIYLQATQFDIYWDHFHTMSIGRINLICIEKDMKLFLKCPESASEKKNTERIFKESVWKRFSETELSAHNSHK